jgi:hypothetical protein
MSDVKVVRYLLANNGPLTAVVPATKIAAGLVPQNTALPAISVTHVSTVRRHTVAGTATEFCTSRVQITVHAATYPTQKSIMTLVRAALPRTRGTVNGVAVDSLLHTLDGPDMSDDAAGIFEGSADYILTYNE